MPEPENHTLHLLREIRGAVAALDSKSEFNHRDLTDRRESIRHAMLGESVLGRYATAEFDERLAALEKRVSVLERR